MKKWHLRVEFFERVEGIKRSASFRDLHHLLTRVQSYIDAQKTNGTVAPRIFVKACPKNHQSLELIE